MIHAVAAARVIERASVWVFSFGDCGQSFDRRSNDGGTRLQQGRVLVSFDLCKPFYLLAVTLIRESRAFKPLLLFYAAAKLLPQSFFRLQCIYLMTFHLVI